MRCAYLRAVRHIPRDGWILILASVSVGMGYFGFHAVAFNLYLLRLGYGPEFIGLLNGVAMGASALCAIPAGIAGRRWGLRRVMLVGFAIWTVMSLLLPLADLMPVVWQTAWLLGTFTINWMAVPLWGVNQPTYLVGITSTAERQYAFAISRAGGRLGAMAGSLLAGLLADRLAVVILGGFLVAGFGYTSMFVSAALLTLAGTLFFWSYLGIPRHSTVPASTE